MYILINVPIVYVDICILGGGAIMRRFKFIRLEDGSLDEDFYSENNRDSMIEDDMLTPLEAAFMRGWDEAE